jgi:hypothetical protein
MDYDEPHLMLNEKTHAIQWTKQPTGALVAASSLWPGFVDFTHISNMSKHSTTNCLMLKLKIEFMCYEHRLQQ